MEVRQVNNPDLIREFITQPDLYDRLSEDHSASTDSWIPNLHLSLWAMVYDVIDDELDIWGMFAFVPETQIVYRFHPAISPQHWGDKQNVEAGKLVLEWFWEHTDALKLVGKAPVIYPDALKWGQRLGFKREGIQRNSFLKNGELHDQYHVGLNRDN